VCRWLHVVMVEHESLGAAAFNEHGQRILLLLPRLLEQHSAGGCRAPDGGQGPDDRHAHPAEGAGLWWPAQHALLSLLASITHLASTSDARLALEYLANGLMSAANARPRTLRWVEAWSMRQEALVMPCLLACAGVLCSEAVARRGGLDVLWGLLGHESCEAVAVFILTRIMHIIAQVRPPPQKPEHV
jgi:hypothetical protein